MSLRQRLLLIIATVMILLGFALALLLTRQAAEDQRNAQFLRAQAAQTIAERVVQQCFSADGVQLSRFHALSTVAVTADSALERMVLLDLEKRVLYEADPATGRGNETRLAEGLELPAFGDSLSDELLNTLGYSFSTRPPKAQPANQRVILLARVRAPRKSDIENTLFWILMSILAGSVMMIGLTYLAVWRLVLHPVELLAQKVDHLAHEERAAQELANRVAGAPPTQNVERIPGNSSSAQLELARLEQELIQSRTPTPLKRDELQRLGAAFDGMAEDLRRHRADLRAQIEKVVAEKTQAQARWIAAERLNATGRLAAGVAHEINNPLGGIRNALRTIRTREQGRESPDPRTLEYLDLMEDGLTRIANIVTDLLGFSRRSSKPETVDVVEIATASQRLMAHRFRDAQTEFELHNRTGDSLCITAERAKLGQIFLNLFANGLDAILERNADPAGRKITLQIDREKEDLVLRVGDTGAGMSIEAQAHVTELFFTTKEPGKGTGLGLAVVASIVSDLNGHLRFESCAIGTTVVIHLPYAATAASSPSAPIHATPSADA